MSRLLTLSLVEVRRLHLRTTLLQLLRRYRFPIPPWPKVLRLRIVGSTFSALDRLAVQPQLSEDMLDGKYARLESRAFSMLQPGLPPSVLEELLANRQLSCVHAIYQVLKTFQPGGLAERSKLLDALQSPGSGGSPKEVLEKLRPQRSSSITSGRN